MNPGRVSNDSVPAARLCLAILLLAPTAEARQPDRAVIVDAIYTGELWNNVAGGIHTGNACLDNLDVSVELDADALWGWPDTTFFLYGLYNNGNALSDRTGDLQAVSNIESDANGFRIHEAWVDKPVGDSGSLRLGLYDLNSEFDVLDAAGVFLHSAHGIGTDFGQTGINGPSIFPITSLAVRFAWDWENDWSLRAAVLDGVPGDPDDPGETDISLSSGDGALLVVEVERSTPGAKLLVGAWRYTAEFEGWPESQASNGSARSRGNRGAYVRGEVSLGGDEVLLFGRYGRAAGEFNTISDFFGAGMSWQGPLPGPDQLGVAIAWAETSSRYRDARRISGEDAEPREVALELTYRIPLGKRLVLQPDLQYIRHPGLDPTLNDAFVVGVRLELELL